MLRYIMVLVALCAMTISGCATVKCEVVKINGNTVYTKGCSDWKPVQYGPKGGPNYCPKLRYPKLKSDGTFNLHSSKNCRNFTLMKRSGDSYKWLVIIPETDKADQKTVCYSDPSGEGHGYVRCSDIYKGYGYDHYYLHNR